MKPKTQHTPGPWKVETHKGDSVFPRIESEDGLLIATMDTVPWNFGQAENNARLIAAAPALLEACKAAFHLVQELRHAFDEVPAGVDAWQAQVWTKTREAIRQVEGE